MPNFTKKAIRESFIKLLNERPLNKITVKDIVEDCGVNRNSFYYHYQDLPALLEEIVSDEVKRIVEEYQEIGSIEDCFRATISFALKNRRAVLHIYKSMNREYYDRYTMDVCSYLVGLYLDRLVGDRAISKSDRELIIKVYACECYGLTCEWMNDGMPDTIGEAFTRLCELRSGLIESMVEKACSEKH